MNFDLESTIVLLAVVLATLYLYSKYFGKKRKAAKAAGCGGSCGCGSASSNRSLPRTTKAR